MKTLYVSPGTCSLAPHIALREAAIPFSTVRVDIRSKQTEHGTPLSEISPKNYLPALVLDDGAVLTEAAVILAYIADLAPEARLAPRAGTFERVRLSESLNFIGSELHKGLGALFIPGHDDFKRVAMARLSDRLSLLEAPLRRSPYLMGDTFTVADAYLFWVLRTWRDLFRQVVPPALGDYADRVSQRASVKAALDAEQE